MNISESQIKEFLERLLPLQESEQQILCPRCGLHELYTGRYFFLNSLSRYAHVYICEKCWMDEALREIDHQPIPLRLWNAAVPLVLSGELPSSTAPSSEGRRI